MKKSLIILIFLATTFSVVHAQVNPLGLYVDINGKIRFWESEATKNESIVDTVFVTVEGSTEVVDLSNLKYDHLTIVEAPKKKWTEEHHQDPTKKYDSVTNLYLDNKIVSKIEVDSFLKAQQILITADIESELPANDIYFPDYLRGSRLDSSVTKFVKSKLLSFISVHYNKNLPESENNDLRHQLSETDTIIDNTYVSDFLVDQALFYNYDKNKKLTKVIGYHWDYGVEVDSLKYNKEGKMIYFSRQVIGAPRHEYFFEYDKKGRVSTIVDHYTNVGEGSEVIADSEPEISKMKFTYDAAGKINSKSGWNVGEIWPTEYYKIP